MQDRWVVVAGPREIHRLLLIAFPRCHQFVLFGLVVVVVRFWVFVVSHTFVQWMNMGQDRIICMPYLRETFMYSVALDLLGEFKRKFKIDCV